MNANTFEITLVELFETYNYTTQTGCDRIVKEIKKVVETIIVAESTRDEAQKMVTLFDMYTGETCIKVQDGSLKSLIGTLKYVLTEYAKKC